MTLRQVLKAQLPTLMGAHEKRPWDYRIHWPVTLDDDLLVTVYVNVRGGLWIKTAEIKVTFDASSVKLESLVNPDVGAIAPNSSSTPTRGEGFSDTNSQNS